MHAKREASVKAPRKRFAVYRQVNGSWCISIPADRIAPEFDPAQVFKNMRCCSSRSRCFPWELLRSFGSIAGESVKNWGEMRA
jgi:hypothetical protein